MNKKACEWPDDRREAAYVKRDEEGRGTHVRNEILLELAVMAGIHLKFSERTPVTILTRFDEPQAGY